MSHNQHSDKLSEDDYYNRSDVFRYWLRNEKDKYMDELSSKDSKKYFKKFVKKWNDGDLKSKPWTGTLNKIEKYYEYSSEKEDFSKRTRYQWGFTKSEGTKNEVGPSYDRVKREEEEEMAFKRKDMERKYKLKQEKERLEELVPRPLDPKEKELEKKKLKREFHRQEKDVDPIIEDVYGEESSFQAAKRAKEAYLHRKFSKRMEEEAEKQAMLAEKARMHREKESQTLSMLKQMAQQRFG